MVTYSVGRVPLIKLRARLVAFPNFVVETPLGVKTGSRGLAVVPTARTHKTADHARDILSESSDQPKDKVLKTQEICKKWGRCEQKQENERREGRECVREKEVSVYWRKSEYRND